MRELLAILLILIFFIVYEAGVYIGGMNIKRIAIERGVAHINQAGEFEFKCISIDSRPCKPDGSC